MMSEKLLVNEVFGPTIQGEGPATGRQCAFIRLAICPLRCRWCDTSYTWAFTEPLALRHQSRTKYSYDEEVHSMTVDEVIDKAIMHLAGAKLVILSGGEPLAQVSPRLQKPDAYPDIDHDPIGVLIYDLYDRGIMTHIETAGIYRPSKFVHQYVERYTVSPKLHSSGNTIKARRKIDVLDFFANTPKADFKFVITKPDDFSEVQYLVNLCDIPRHRVWVMPEGTSWPVLQRGLPMVAEGAIKNGYNISTRLHVNIWGDKRGV
jgi:7-carboxy-7-deazaguanine synthase